MMKKTTGCFAAGGMHAQPCVWELMLLIGSIRARLQQHIEVQYVPDFMVRHLTHMKICMTGRVSKECTVCDASDACSHYW